MYYMNPDVKNLYRIFDQNNRSGYLRLDLNENPGGLPQDFIQHVLSDISSQEIAQYPETEQFTKTLSQYLGTDNSHICLTNGSAEGIRYIIEAFTSEGGKIVGVVPSYFMFQIYAEMYGRSFVRVPYESDLNMNIDKLIEALDLNTQLLVLLNPNNPMGNVYSEDEFVQILDVAKRYQITVLIDEAYHYFHPNSFMSYALSEPHVFVTRTFSKLFSMAGCRLGYVVGWPDGIQMVQKLCTPHNTNVVAMKLATAVLSTPGMIEELIQKYNEGRSYLIEYLDNNDYEHKGEAGNFIFIKPKRDASMIVARMKQEKKILIKKYSQVGDLGDCLRVTIGEKQHMKQFTEALADLDSI